MVFKTAAIVPESGVYRVVHDAHRLPLEVTLLKGQAFPRCANCADYVVFEPLKLAPDAERRGRVIVYELPEVDPSSGA